MKSITPPGMPNTQTANRLYARDMSPFSSPTAFKSRRYHNVMNSSVEPFHEDYRYKSYPYMRNEAFPYMEQGREADMMFERHLQSGSSPFRSRGEHPFIIPDMYAGPGGLHTGMEAGELYGSTPW